MRARSIAGLLALSMIVAPGVVAGQQTDVITVARLALQHAQQTWAMDQRMVVDVRPLTPDLVFSSPTDVWPAAALDSIAGGHARARADTLHVEPCFVKRCAIALHNRALAVSRPIFSGDSAIVYLSYWTAGRMPFGPESATVFQRVRLSRAAGAWAVVASEAVEPATRR